MALLVCPLHALLVGDVDALLEDGAHDAVEGPQVAEARLDHRQQLVLVLLRRQPRNERHLSA